MCSNSQLDAMQGAAARVAKAAVTLRKCMPHLALAELPRTAAWHSFLSLLDSQPKHAASNGDG